MEISKADRDYEQGLGDGYNGAPKVSDPTVAYLMGYEDGENNYTSDWVGAHSEDYDYGYEAEQAYYDEPEFY